MPLPQTLPDLLYARAADSTSASSAPRVAYLDADGAVYKSLTYADLFHAASTHATRLLAAGLTSQDVILASFPDHESHVLLFWACCLAGIPVCPLPPLHPDPSRQALLFNHLQALFHGPTLIAPATLAEAVRQLVPELKVLVAEDLPPPHATDAAFSHAIFPTRHASPHDVVCFMLTSGSTGNSKAVQLRHANLLSSVRGKIQHHGTTSASRLFNWIAFDHVACVSEIHIHALEANAR
jgi:acyl-CoA synthetase (AMP-forming)/AMP-acid ligase II